jgi:WD40 repeat protein
MGVLQFSQDGSKVFVAGYPSGVVQVFDVNSGKELRRVNGPRGFRSSMSYAVPSSDWKTAYIAVEVRKHDRAQKDGKTVIIPNWTGEIRVFDLMTGEEKPALKRPDNGAVATVHLSADGKMLRTYETFSRLNEKGERTNSTGEFEWDLATGTSRKRQDGHWEEKRSKDGRWSASARVDYHGLTARLAVTNTKMSKETVLLDDKQTTLGFVSLSADGRFLAASIYRFAKGRNAEFKVWELGTMREAPVQSLKLDAVTDLTFSPDGSVLVAWTFPGGTRLIDTATWKDRELPGKDSKDTFQRFTFSADGKQLALVATRFPPGWERARDPDPLDFPQPRIYLYDLTTSNPPRVMVCPQGFVTKLEFDPTGKWLAAGGTGAVWMFDVGQ